MSSAKNYVNRTLRRDPCSYCGRNGPSNIDHITASARGGPDHWSNFTAACALCNSRKNEHSLLTALIIMRLIAHRDTVLTELNHWCRQTPGREHEYTRRTRRNPRLN